MSTSETKDIAELGQKIAGLANSLHDVDDALFSQSPPGTSNRTSIPSADIRESLISLLNEMLEKIQGPTRTLIEMTNTARVRLSVIRVIIHFNLAMKIPENGSISFIELASTIRVDQSLLERVLRFAFSQRIFQETSPGSGEVSHTPLSKKIPLLAPWFTLILSSITVRSDLSLPEALESSLEATGSKTAVEIAFKKNFWEVIKSLAYLDTFQDGLRSLSNAQKACLVPGGGDLFRWEEQQNALVIDIGGGDGHSAVEAATKNSELHFIVQDLEENRSKAEDCIPLALRKRVLFQAHDFFTVQRQILRRPVTFYMRWILHDWPDDRCVEILTQLLPLLAQAGSRLLVHEYLLSHLAHVRAMDMTMLTFFNSGAGERSLAGFEALFRQVDPRIRIVKVMDTDEWGMRILEVVLNA